MIPGKINIRVIKFWTKYTPLSGGEVRAVDMVEYCAPGMAQKASTVAPVSHLSKVRADADPDNVAYQMANDRWAIIGPAYEAWKKGKEIPINGTPLAAWPGITPEQADVLREFGLRTVEEIAGAGHDVITRVKLPGMLDLQRSAQMFIGAKDQTRVAAEIARRDTELAELKDQLEEMRQIVLAQQQETPGGDDLEPDGSEAPRRRGRPPKARPAPEHAA